MSTEAEEHPASAVGEPAASAPAGVEREGLEHPGPGGHAPAPPAAVDIEHPPAPAEAPDAPEHAPAGYEQAPAEHPAAAVDIEHPPAPAEAPDAHEHAPAGYEQAPAEHPAAAVDAEHGQAPAEHEPEAVAATPEQAPAARRAKPRQRRGRRPAAPRNLPRSRAPLPLDELRDASRATLDLFGRQAVREAFGILAQRERRDLSDLIARDEDHRPRARNIANGSLGAGRIDKAMSATIVSMARREDLWHVALDKELAAEKLGRVRAAKQRDQRRAERARDREQRADRISKADLEKARDGRVGATIRIVTEDERRGRRGRDRGEQERAARDSVLDRLGY